MILFADEASFAQWGSLNYTRALRGHQPTVKTTGKRKAYKMMGMIDYFSGRLFFAGSTERFTAARYYAFLATILAETSQPIIVVHEGASYHKLPAFVRDALLAFLEPVTDVSAVPTLGIAVFVIIGLSSYLHLELFWHLWNVFAIDALFRRDDSSPSVKWSVICSNLFFLSSFIVFLIIPGLAIWWILDLPISWGAW